MTRLRSRPLQKLPNAPRSPTASPARSGPMPYSGKRSTSLWSLS